MESKAGKEDQGVAVGVGRALILNRRGAKFLKSSWPLLWTLKGKREPCGSLGESTFQAEGKREQRS